ncbi:MAG: ATP-binding protein [Thermomicrobiales bacterium]
MVESPGLQIHLLGAFEMRQDAAVLPSLESARAESLLAYLLLHRGVPQPRQRLAFLLWPDSTEAQARTNLRHLLHTLRHALPDIDRFLDVTPRTLQWRPNVPLWLDVGVFTEAMRRALQDRADELSALREAIEVYRGDLLEGCYDEWIIDERERLQTQLLNALERLTSLLDARGDYAEAIRYADLLLQHDPLREETYRLLMRLHDVRGDRARALHVYHVCAATLERELGVEPAAATRSLYEALLPDDRQVVVPQRQGTRLGGPPLVGRQSEWSCLTSLWHEAASGRAQFVQITGEPGIGKTRLVEEFRFWCVHHGAIAAEGRSYAAEGTLAYGQVAAWLRAEAIRARLDRLDRASFSELSRLLPELRVDGFQPEPLSENEQRQRLFEAGATAMLTSGVPVLLVADDLQWCDRESLQFLHYVIRARPEARLLVAATARSDEVDDRHPLGELQASLHRLDRCTEIQLERLTLEEIGALAGHILGRPVEEPDVHMLYQETEGSPLFVVEVLRAGWQSGGTGRASMSPKVQAVIQARLAQLSDPARALVDYAATIGRAFPTDVLANAADANEDQFVHGLDELWRRRIIREQGAGMYDFGHDKIREVAYLSLSPARRSQVHLRVAQALESRFAQDLDQVSGELARHYEGAGRKEQAIVWYGRAAEAALQLHSNDKAVRLIEKALDLLRALPETSEQLRRELALLEPLSAPLGISQGWATDRMATMLNRALDLSRALGLEPSSPILRSLSIASLSRRDFAAASDYGERLRARGERNANDILLVEADYVLGIAAYWQGGFQTARAHFEAAVRRYAPAHRREHLLHYGLDPKVICLSRLANTLWVLGYPASAIRAKDDALAFANQVGHSYSREVTLVFAAFLALELHDNEAIRAYAQEFMRLQGEHGTRAIQTNSRAFDGYVDILDGRQAGGIARIQQALADVDEADYAPGQRSTIWRLLLEAYVVAGDALAGLAATNGALASASGGRLYEAEFRRLRAEFLIALGAGPDQVESELERSLAVAQNQGALMYELRTAMSLLRYRQELCGEDEKTREARQGLTAIVAELPEKHANPDLSEAVTLLSQN